MRIAVLEDDPAQADLLLQVLTRGGHLCAHFSDGEVLRARLRGETFDLLLLDWNVPGLSGLDLLSWVRTALASRPAVIMLTARTQSADIVAALNAGADDYVSKPVDNAVLLARINAVLRRLQSAEPTSQAELIAGLKFDPLSETVTGPAGEVQLTSKEFALALSLFRNLNRPLSRAYLLETVWGRRPDLATRTLDAHVSRLRTKLDLRPERGYRLAPVYSFGYRLEHDEAAQGGRTE